MASLSQRILPHWIGGHRFQNPAISSLTSTGDVSLVRISTDGRYLVYVSTKRGQSSLWVRQIAIESAVQIVPPEASRQIVDAAFTPDGNYVDYIAYSSFATVGPGKNVVSCKGRIERIPH